MAAGDVTVSLTQNDSHKGAKLDGVDDVLTASDANEFNYDTTRDFSFCFWYFCHEDLSSATNRMFSKTDISEGNGWFCDIHHNIFRWFTRTGSTYSIVIDSGVVFFNNWRHIACTFDRDVGGKIYINGAEVATTEGNLANLATDNINSGLGLQIGKLDTQGTNLANGIFADIQMYDDKILTATEVSNIFNNVKVAEGLRARWNFELDTYADSVGSNDLTNSGTFITTGDAANTLELNDTRTGANDIYLCWDGLHGKLGTVHIEEA